MEARDTAQLTECTLGSPVPYTPSMAVHARNATVWNRRQNSGTRPFLAMYQV